MARVSLPSEVICSALLDVPIHLFTEQELTHWVCDVARKRRGVIVGNVNLHSLALARRGGVMRQFLSASDAVHIDGMPVVWLARLAGIPAHSRHRITYVEWIHRLASEVKDRGLRMFFLGGRRGVGETAADVLRSHHPGLQLAVHHGYFDATSRSPEDDAVVERISQWRPHILIVGMSMPRQEEWILSHRDRLPVGVYLNGGAVMDYVAGAVPTPPRWAGRMGLEWLARLVVDPRRLAYRYLIEPWTLAIPLLAEVWRRRVR